jgi:uncharacterized membrane protein
MAEQVSNLRLNSERLGSVEEIRQFLSDFENAYNHLYAFDVIVDSIYEASEKGDQIANERFEHSRRLFKEFSRRKDFPIDPFFFEIFYRDYYIPRQSAPRPNLLELHRSIEFSTFILPGDKLQLSKISIESPGFWEFIGTLNPLQQIREYLKDRHERNKDNKYRSRQEEEQGDLDTIMKREGIISQRIDILRKAGYSDTEIRQFINVMIVKPLNLLGGQQDNQLIGGPEE